MGMKLLCIANARLGATCLSLGSHGRAQRAQMLHTFVALGERARAEQVQAVLVLGDLFDCAMPAAHTIEAIQHFFLTLHDAGIAAVVLPGARDPDALFDPERQPDGLVLCPHATILGAATPSARLEIADAAVQVVAVPTTAAPRQEDRPPLSLVEADPATPLIGLGYAPALADLQLEHLQPVGARNGMRVVVCGGDTSFATRRLDDLLVCSPGAPEPIEWDRDGGTVAVIALDGDRPPVIDAQRCGVRRLARRQIAVTPDTARDVAARIRDMADPQLALELVLTGGCPFDVAIDPAALENDLAHQFFHLRVVDRTTLLLTDREIQALPQGTILSNFVRVMNTRMRDAVDDTQAALEREAYHLGLELLQGAGGAS